ncbi:MAG: hypothetical protein ACYCOR_17410 [Acidobacteriaceae bacterium]
MTLTYQLLFPMILTLAIPAASFGYFWLHRGKGPFEMDPMGQPGEFLPILKNYLKLADGLLALAIVTLGYIASPVILHKIVPYDPEHLGSITLMNAWAPFVTSFLCILFFKVLLVIWYESYRHTKNSYTPFRYAIIKALPLAGLVNLIVGYGTIAIDVALWVHNGGGNLPPTFPHYY